MNNILNGMFSKVAPNMCRLGMNGEIAIKTSNGYVTYNVKTGTLTNCDNFAFDVGEDWFFIIPTNKVNKGDIILAGGRPRCVIDVKDNTIKAFCYEDRTVSEIVPEHHMFMGKQYFYGKLISLFGNMMSGKGGMNNMFKYMMMSEMLKGMSGRGNYGDTNNPMASMMPMMMMMNGGMNFMDGLFSFDEDDTEAEGEATKEEEV